MLQQFGIVRFIREVLSPTKRQSGGIADSIPGCITEPLGMCRKAQYVKIIAINDFNKFAFVRHAKQRDSEFPARDSSPPLAGLTRI